MRNLSITALLFLISIAFGFSKTITGTVTGSGLPLPGVNVTVKGGNSTVTDFDGLYTIDANLGDEIAFSSIGFITQKVTISESNNIINVSLKEDVETLTETVIVGYGTSNKKDLTGSVTVLKPEGIRPTQPISFEQTLIANSPGVKVIQRDGGPGAGLKVRVCGTTSILIDNNDSYTKESYASLSENNFKSPLQTPLSTFSIDVDAASYSNVRRFIMNGSKPPKDAVRVEEMINYFKYNYPQPKNEHPFSLNYEVSRCPWNKDNQLVHIGLQGKTIDLADAPANNLVFLIDVSGSMSDYNKLPLLKKAFKLLVNQMRKKDRVSIVVYAGSSGLVLPSTKGDNKEKILVALENLHAGGSTAGAEGLKLAYKIAQKNFINGGNNRIILATDGDFNVGPYSDSEMEKLVIANRDNGIFISVAGFGMGNYKDSKMEIIANKGNGNYAYIDNLLEAKKVFVNEFGGTMFTIAKDVKIQIEFNPLHVKEYRLVGYENRLLNAEDFNDDKKDAGELGAGHTVTALYEIVPTVTNEVTANNLKYQTPNGSNRNEIASIKFRYKSPTDIKSKLIVQTIENKEVSLSDSSENFKFSSAVAGFGMLLSNSKYKKELSFKDVLTLAKNGKGGDEFGYRGEFIRLVELTSELYYKSKL